MTAKTLLLASAFVGLSLAHGVLHEEPALPGSWSRAAYPVAADQPVQFTVAVRERNLGELKRTAAEVSDPDSARYGQYLSQAALDALVAPASADVDTVTSWLAAAGVQGVQRVGVSSFVVRASAATASRLLRTSFHTATNSATAQTTVRAASYSLPPAVHAAVAAIFGLHGLPLPPTRPLVVTSSAGPSAPANVTPAVLASTYAIGGVQVTRSEKNRQAVAEFQGQLMSGSDLEQMFASYVADYKKGEDDKVDHAVGSSAATTGNGVEAELDIQYIMGPAVGIKTDFYEYPGNDFCNDLHQWTGNLTSTADIPLVHSVSYGWQGNLSTVGCKDADLQVVDANFAKLAAKGISIMISSGDSGSGYSPQNSQCMAPSGGGSEGVALEGTVRTTTQAQSVTQCCEMMQSEAGWTFVPAHKASGVAGAATGAPTFGNATFADTPFHTVIADTKSPVFKLRNEHALNGVVDATGGSVKTHSLNGSYADTSIVFGEPAIDPHAPPGFALWSVNVTATFNGKSYSGKANFIDPSGAGLQCMNIEWAAADGHSQTTYWEHGGNPPPPPPPGTCVGYSAVSGQGKNSSATSGTKPAHPKVQLWPSWPASSPWVTAVGATRFVGQKVGNAEMATDQFGSGGGFSDQFGQSPNAEYQAAAVANYLKTVDASTLPPAGSFDPKGRATPDVSALGEGYQVVVRGRVQPVGGTSASSPAFASMVSLLNEARLNAGKPAMGFLNPFLYKNQADGFTDVTLGSNKIGRGGGMALPYGFNCSKGWDPATGLGTPRFDKLLSAAMAAAE